MFTLDLKVFIKIVVALRPSHSSFLKSLFFPAGVASHLEDPKRSIFTISFSSSHLSPLCPYPPSTKDAVLLPFFLSFVVEGSSMSPVKSQYSNTGKVELEAELFVTISPTSLDVQCCSSLKMRCVFYCLKTAAKIVPKKRLHK